MPNAVEPLYKCKRGHITQNFEITVTSGTESWKYSGCPRCMGELFEEYCPRGKEVVNAV